MGKSASHLNTVNPNYLLESDKSETLPLSQHRIVLSLFQDASILIRDVQLQEVDNLTLTIKE